MKGEELKKLGETGLEGRWGRYWHGTDFNQCISSKPNGSQSSHGGMLLSRIDEGIQVRAIEEIQMEDVLAHVTIRAGDNSIVESVITRRSPEEMRLKESEAVTAVVKATEVMIAKP